MSDRDIASKFRRLIELREHRDETKATAETAEREYRAYESEVFDEMAEGSLKGSLRIDLGPPHGTVRFTPRETYYSRIIDADAAVEYFEKRGQLEEMSKPHLVSRRLNELVRDHLERGQNMPEGIDFYARRGITISRLS